MLKCQWRKSLAWFPLGMWTHLLTRISVFSNLWETLLPWSLICTSKKGLHQICANRALSDAFLSPTNSSQTITDVKAASKTMPSLNISVRLHGWSYSSYALWNVRSCKHIKTFLCFCSSLVIFWWCQKWRKCCIFHNVSTVVCHFYIKLSAICCTSKQLNWTTVLVKML